MARPEGIQGIVSALILGACVLGAGFLVSRSLDEVRGEVARLAESVGEVQGALSRRGPERPPRQGRRRGPDPERIYSIDTSGSPAKGPEDAPVTVVEFSDFQCPYCARVAPTLARIEQEYGDRVRIVFKHLPLSMHPKAPAAHAAAEAARLQGKFWEMHDRIFANQREMSEERYEEYAQELSLDLARFRRDVASRTVKERVDRDLQEARRLEVTGTPSFFVNGRFLSGARRYEEFQELIEAGLRG